MVPPKNARLIDFPTSMMWFDEDGILCSVSKKVSAQSLEQVKKTIEEFKKITGGKKVCLLSDTTNSQPVNKEIRDYIGNIIPELVKAVAMVSRSALGRMVANLYFGLKPPSYPVKMFSDEQEAKKWLKQYL